MDKRVVYFVLIIILSGLPTPFLQASTDSAPELTLSCSVHASNFGAESGLIASEKVTIKGSVLTQGGRHLVHEAEGLEFWVLTHMTQKLGDDHFINKPRQKNSWVVSGTGSAPSA